MSDFDEIRPDAMRLRLTHKTPNFESPIEFSAMDISDFVALKGR